MKKLISLAIAAMFLVSCAGMTIGGSENFIIDFSVVDPSLPQVKVPAEFNGMKEMDLFQPNSVTPMSQVLVLIQWVNETEIFSFVLTPTRGVVCIGHATIAGDNDLKVWIFDSNGNPVPLDNPMENLDAFLMKIEQEILDELSRSGQRV